MTIPFPGPLRAWLVAVLAAAMSIVSSSAAPVAAGAGTAAPGAADATAAPAPVGRFSTAYGFRGHAGLYPYGMEYDERNNTILVADIWNHRVKPFTTGGSRARGTTFTGRGFGLPFDRIEPFDVEADPRDGDVYVANEAYSRVDHYRADGTWLRSIGKGGAYGQGCGGGKVHWPTNIAVHPGNGRLYVSDGFCGTVNAYDANFNFLPGVSFDLRRLGVAKPTVRGIDVDAAGNVWVVEHNSRTLLKFRPDGGAPVVATHVARMSDPRGLAVDRGRNRRTRGRVYVVAGFHNEVHVFHRDGGYRTRWTRAGTSPRAPAFDAIRYVAVDRSGNVYVGDTWKYVVYKLSPTGARRAWAQRPLPPPRGGFNQMSGIGLHPGSGRSSQRLFVADYFEQRVQWFATHTRAGRTSRCRSPRRCPAWRGQFGSRRPNVPGSPGIAYPRALTVGGGWVWVDGGQSVVRYDRNGRFVSRFGRFGARPGQFKGGPTGIRVIGTRRRGRVYTTDTGNCRIQVTSYRGRPVATMGSCGTRTSRGEMGLPQQIDVDRRTGLAYVADGAVGRNRIHVWRMAAKRMRSFDVTVGGTGLNRPRGVVLDRARKWLYISDSGNRRVIRVRLDRNGYPTGRAQLVTRGGDTRDRFARLGQPRALAFGPRDGKLYISDFNQRVYAYTVPR